MITQKLLLATAVLSLTACQTTGSAKTSEEVLFSGLTSERSSEVKTNRKAEDPICVRYYANATQYAATSKRQGLASGFMKTLALGSLAGAASGGVGSLGISSSFVELALAGAANQVVFQGGSTALDTLTDKSEGVEMTPIEEIEAGALELGCPKPQKATARAAQELTKSNEDEG
jgi:hypothetical protein